MAPPPCAFSALIGSVAAARATSAVVERIGMAIHDLPFAVLASEDRRARSRYGVASVPRRPGPVTARLQPVEDLLRAAPAGCTPTGGVCSATMPAGARAPSQSPTIQMAL